MMAKFMSTLFYKLLFLVCTTLLQLKITIANKLTLTDFRKFCKYYDSKFELECDTFSPLLTELPPIPVHMREKIRHLQIRNLWNFERVPTKAFEDFKNLQTIYIDSTGLKTIEPRGFYGLEQLKSVYLKNNPSLTNFTWLSFASSSKTFETLDLDESSPPCSCNLKWLKDWRLLSNISENGLFSHVPGSHVGQYTEWGANWMPKNVKGGQHCTAKSGERIFLSDHFSQEDVCQNLDPKISLTMHDTMEMDAPLQHFNENTTKILKCQVENVPSSLNMSGKLEIRIQTKSATLRSVPSPQPGAVANIIQAPGIIFGWATCTLIAPLEYSPQPIGQIIPLITKGAPEIAELHPIKTLPGVEKQCYAEVMAYPQAKLEWFFGNDPNPLDLNGTGPGSLRSYDPEKEIASFHQEGRLRVREFNMNSGVYKLRACNRYGCSVRKCPLIWASDMPGTHRPPTYPSRTGRKTSLPQWVVSTIIVIGIGCSLCCCIIVILQLYYRRRIKKKGDTLVSVRYGDLSHRMNLLQSASVEFEQNYLYQSTENDPFSPTTVPIIHATKLAMLCEIGEGCFSTVHRAELTVQETEHPSIVRKIDEDASDSSIYVAVKCPKNWHSQQVREGLVHEIGCLNSLTHPNIVQFLGVCQQRERSHVWLVFEYMELGSLRTLLQDSGGKAISGEDRSPPVPELSELDLLHISKQIAQGLAYLTANHVVHRDLATRNCLVKSGLTVKLSDFGMSRDIYYAEYYKITGQRAMPVRWMSPEALTHGVFTHAGDMWSFGVVLWEIFTLGKQPFYGFSNVEVIAKVQNQESLSPPDDCDTNVQNLMKDCWNFEPSARPKTSTVAGVLETLHTAKQRAKDSSQKQRRDS